MCASLFSHAHSALARPNPLHSGQPGQRFENASLCDHAKPLGAYSCINILKDTDLWIKRIGQCLDFMHHLRLHLMRVLERSIWSILYRCRARPRTHGVRCWRPVLTSELIAHQFDAIPLARFKWPFARFHPPALPSPPHRSGRRALATSDESLSARRSMSTCRGTTFLRPSEASGQGRRDLPARRRRRTSAPPRNAAQRATARPAGRCMYHAKTSARWRSSMKVERQGAGPTRCSRHRWLGRSRRSRPQALSPGTQPASLTAAAPARRSRGRRRCTAHTPRAPSPSRSRARRSGRTRWRPNRPSPARAATAATARGRRAAARTRSSPPLWAGCTAARSAERSAPGSAHCQTA
mmetsp:Transcript_18112/g.41647  ORF Transcript_18112/g.41647 Transcript_18112/m.41647 type:complete len:352 (-) Transcript_18112:112-1167(-)